MSLRPLRNIALFPTGLESSFVLFLITSSGTSASNQRFLMTTITCKPRFGISMPHRAVLQGCSTSVFCSHEELELYMDWSGQPDRQWSGFEGVPSNVAALPPRWRRSGVLRACTSNRISELCTMKRRTFIYQASVAARRELVVRARASLHDQKMPHHVEQTPTRKIIIPPQPLLEILKLVPTAIVMPRTTLQGQDFPPTQPE